MKNLLQQVHATRDAAIADNRCVSCKQAPDLDTFTDAGKREFQISGMCEPCFDGLFPPED